MADLIDRQELRKAMYHEAFETDSDEQRWDGGCWIRYKMFERVLDSLPSAQPVEPLTDKEKRIFLAAMGRELKVCQEVDRNYTREPYEDSLVRVCREIERKVKGALWTN